MNYTLKIHNTPIRMGLKYSRVEDCELLKPKSKGLTKLREDIVHFLSVGEEDARSQLLSVEVFPGVALVSGLPGNRGNHDIDGHIEQLRVLVWCV